MPTLIELSARFPWVRRHRCTPVQTPAAAVPDDVHRSWVMTAEGRGFLHSHDAHGYWIQLDDGRLIQTNDFTAVAAP